MSTIKVEFWADRKQTNEDFIIFSGKDGNGNDMEAKINISRIKERTDKYNLESNICHHPSID